MPVSTTINTKTAPKRAPKLDSLADLKIELDNMQVAHDQGELVTTGNWSAGQILEHVSTLPEHAIDGFPGMAPWPIRVIVQLLFKKAALAGKPPSPGMTIPDQASFLKPSDTATFETGMARLRRVLERIDSGERMTHPSPIFGSLTHEQWVTINLGHMKLHFAFISGGPLGAAT